MELQSGTVKADNPKDVQGRRLGHSPGRAPCCRSPRTAEDDGPRIRIGILQEVHLRGLRRLVRPAR
eukprot:1706004-Prymnesium_polylepis.1